MSPLVISRNQASGENLVESTKLERIIIDSITAPREEKKAKKERRKHKKVKHEKSHKHSLRIAHDDHKQIKSSSVEILDESDQLEKSGLTEEREEPQNHLCYLSDGSQNSKKRKRDESPPALESLIKAAPVAGNPLRIRLIFKKPKTGRPSLSREDLPVSSTSGLIDREPVVLSSVSCSKVSEPEEKLQTTTSVAAVSELKKKKKQKPSKEDRYNALFDDWTRPSSICFPAKEDDDDWLFGNRTQEKLNLKAVVKIDEDTNMCLHRPRNSSCHRAQFLSEVGIYSLPYTVPF